MTTTWHHPPHAGARRAPARLRPSSGAAWQGLTESLMDQITDPTKLAREPLKKPAAPTRRRTWRTAAILTVTVLALLVARFASAPHKANQAAAVPAPAPPV